MPSRRRLGLVPLLVLGLACVLGCRARGADAPAAVAALRFPHEAAAHASIACTTCHAEADVRAGRPARPGRRDHAPCDQAGCHATAFAVEPGELCGLCHDDVAPWQPGGTTLAPYPPATSERAVPAAFSHAAHLDKARLDATVGFHVACGDCHVRGPSDADYGVPAHLVCGRCHERAQSKAPLSDCRSCHTRGARPARRGRVLIGPGVRFDHVSHEADRAGRPVACVRCHREVGTQERATARATPTMDACVSCHDDPEQVPDGLRMSACGGCHASPAGAGLELVAPRSHLPPRDRPDDHTLAFRKDHGADARRAPEACATCHTGLSGRRDNCDECHQSMRPGDHNASWTELTHGREAVDAPRRCATCHAADLCTTCHAGRRPRSHLGWSTMAPSLHAGPARQNPRACQTCHDFATSCASAGCHQGVAP